MVNNGHCLFPEDCDLWVLKPWAGYSAKGEKRLKWNWYKEIQGKHQNDDQWPRWCCAWKSKVYFEMNKYWVWEKKKDKIRSYTDKTSRQMEFIITKKDGQKKKEWWNRIEDSLKDRAQREKGKQERITEWEKEVDGHTHTHKEFASDQLQQWPAMKSHFSTWPSCSPLQWQSLPPGWPHPLLSHSRIMSVGSL